jgi:hypothetical protein
MARILLAWGGASQDPALHGGGLPLAGRRHVISRTVDMDWRRLIVFDELQGAGSAKLGANWERRTRDLLNPQ